MRQNEDADWQTKGRYIQLNSLYRFREIEKDIGEVKKKK